MKKLTTSLAMLCCSAVFAQGETSVLRSSGKIYVVVGIIAIIFTLIALYLYRLDRKISKLEKKIK